MSLKYPIEQGVLLDMDEFEILTLNILSNQLKLEATEETPFIFSEPSVPQKDYWLKLAELAFEKLDIPEIAIINS